MPSISSIFLYIRLYSSKQLEKISLIRVYPDNHNSIEIHLSSLSPKAGLLLCSKKVVL